MAAGLVRAAADERRGEAVKGKVSTAARTHCARLPSALGRVSLPSRPPSRRPCAARSRSSSATRHRRRVLSPRPCARCSATPRLQVAGLAYLTSALVKDMIDVRAAFPFVSRLLASDDPAVREAAAALACYAADLQGATEEAQRMRAALEARVEDASPRVREHVAAAIRALERESVAR